jgi:hypothetical protein
MESHKIHVPNHQPVIHIMGHLLRAQVPISVHSLLASHDSHDAW